MVGTIGPFRLPGSPAEENRLDSINNLGGHYLLGNPQHHPSLEIKKIPKAVLAKCEWGHDDYSLKIENLPKAPPPKGQQELF